MVDSSLVFTVVVVTLVVVVTVAACHRALTLPVVHMICVYDVTIKNPKRRSW